MRLVPAATVLALLALSTTTTLAEQQPLSHQAVLDQANAQFAQGKFGDAANLYTQAIDLDPTSYLPYYRRATAYLSLGRNAAALSDLDAVLKLQPSLDQARLRKAELLVKEGSFTKAREELDLYRKKHKADSNAIELDAKIKAAEKQLAAAKKAHKAGNFDAALENAAAVLQVAPNALDVREMRVDSFLALGAIEDAVGDMTRIAHLRPSSPALLLRLAHLSYFLLSSYDPALSQIKQCLHSDPESKPCKRFFRLLKSLQKDLSKAQSFVASQSWRAAASVLAGKGGLTERVDEALAAGQRAEEWGLGEPPLPPGLDVEKNSALRREVYALACKAYVQLGTEPAKAQRFCDVTLVLDPENTDALVSQAERMLKEEKYEEAVRTLEKAFEATGRSSQDIASRLQRAQKLLKQSRSKDYYKVLGVPRDADERAIKKAFRTKAKDAHPDKGGSVEQMERLNEAYGVLSDPELRRRFDAGDDPNDPEAGRGGPWQHGGGGQAYQFFQQSGFPGGFPGGFQFPGGAGSPFGQGGGRGGQTFHFQWG